MATTQAMRSLKYLKHQQVKTAEINTAINKALNWLQVEKNNGSFQDSGGFDDPLVDSVEVLLTLKTLSIDPASWKSQEERSDYLQNEA